jgi:hypothetical protein
LPCQHYRIILHIYIYIYIYIFPQVQESLLEDQTAMRFALVNPRVE